MSLVLDVVNADPRIAGLSMDSAIAAPGEMPVLATPAALAAAGAWVTANKAAVAGAGAFGALFGAGVWVGASNAGEVIAQ